MKYNKLFSNGNGGTDSGILTVNVVNLNYLLVILIMIQAIIKGKTKGY